MKCGNLHRIRRSTKCHPKSQVKNHQQSAKNRLSSESFKYKPMEKGKHLGFTETKPKHKRRNKKFSLEDTKPKDLNFKNKPNVFLE